MESYKEQDFGVKSAIFGRENYEEESKQTILEGVGVMVLAIACCKGISTMFLIEKWRVQVFLVLNFLLLAIFVTSKRGNCSGGKQQWAGKLGVETDHKEEAKNKEEVTVITRGQRGLTTEIEEPKECERDKSDGQVNNISEGNEEEDVKVMCDAPKLSKEEFNKRVEAFIFMFRQQLILDARNGRNSRVPRP